MTDVRKMFLDFFVTKNHTQVPSSSLVPQNDPTLLFTNAGMNQFKDVFLGKEKSKFSKAVSSQKCVRAGGKHNDLENVGYTARHHTFFEMLGNFSFGDYFKEEAIALAWEFITKELGLDEKRLFVSVFATDDEAYGIWTKKIGIDPKRVFRFGEKDNFWAMGDTGPCGPCSEIFFDMKFDGKLPDQKAFESDGDRFMEFWNLVFMQYMQFADGSRKPLPAPSIDTGMGLERITSILEGASNNYETSLFKELLLHISSLSNQDYFAIQDPVVKISQKVLADHIRSISFLIADGVTPSKEGRGYVLRRIMRRAMRHGNKINIPLYGLSELSKTLVSNYGDHYQELQTQSQLIFDVIYQEEERFSKTIDRGMSLLQQEIDGLKKGKKQTLDGSVAFHLYDTYGFPKDLTMDVLREQQLSLDEKKFEQAFDEHREKARGSWKGNQTQNLENFVAAWSGKKWQTEFLGYESMETASKILAIVSDGVEVDQAVEGQDVSILLDQTPFYGESGGQVGDIGVLTSSKGVAQVLDTQKLGQDFFIHQVQVTDGRLQIGDLVETQVDNKLRLDTAKNHTATHILHATLKEVLGDHVQQKGSLVSPERLRFDFTHSKGLTKDEILKIETIINERIWQNSNLVTDVLSIEEAKKTGAVSMFGEKYSDVVRVLTIGNYSKEFCGGTHVTATGTIGFFKIIKEGSVSAGIRRIEALTGKRAFDFMMNVYQTAQAISEDLGVPLDKTQDRLKMVLQKQKDKKTSSVIEVSVDKVAQIQGISVLVQKVDDPTQIREMADRYLEKMQKGIVVLGAMDAKKAFLVAKVSKDLTGKVHAGNLVKLGASVLGGSGGGRPDFAQAGGTQIDQLDQALKEMENNIKSLI